MGEVLPKHFCKQKIIVPKNDQMLREVLHCTTLFKMFNEFKNDKHFWLILYENIDLF